MSTELARYGGPSSAVARASLPERMEYAKALAQAGLLPDAYRQNPANVLLAIEKSEALGIHHMVGIESIHIIKGKSTLSAELMRALIQRAGHMFDIVEQTNEKAIVECSRREKPEKVFRHEWTVQDANAAELTTDHRSEERWRKFRKSMLVARVTSEAARTHFADVLAGMVYTPEEMGADVDDAGRIIDVTATATVGPTVASPPVTDPAVAQDLAQRIEAAAGPDALRALWTEVKQAQVNRQIIPAMGDAMRDAITARGPVDERTLTRLHTVLTNRGVSDRDERLLVAARLAGRADLESTKELTRGEAAQVIAAVEATGEDVDLLTGETIPPGAGVSAEEVAAAETNAAATWDGQA